MVVVADMHCGHRAGLTPPEWQSKNEQDPFLKKISDFQNELWNWYKSIIEQLQPINLIVSNGDAIDGRGEKSGGTEIIKPDRNDQIKMAEYALKISNAEKYLIINGTPYHTGKEEDWECVLAEKLNAIYANHEFIKVEDVIFDFKHKVSSSIIPHGRFTAPRRAALWNLMHAIRGTQNKADYIIRSHVHYYTKSEDALQTVITTPAMQGWSKFGSRECEGTNDIGFICFDVDKRSVEQTNYIFNMKKYADNLRAL
jgi:hypothetical protein